MSLIVTHISSFGVLQIADSALTNLGPPVTDAGDATKVFAVPQFNAALSVAGSYSVGVERLEQWLNDFIASRSNVADLRAFANDLGTELTNQATGTQAHIVHLAGYGHNPLVGTIPEFWHVRNYGGMDETTGAYVSRSGTYAVSEDFQTVNMPSAGGWPAFQAGAEMIYVNGLVHGRVIFNSAFQSLSAIESALVNDPTNALRAPQSMVEMEKRIVRRFELVGDVFSRNSYGARIIGGTTQVIALPQP